MSNTTLPSFSAAAKSIKENSIYEHYKGFKYKIISVALHSETLEELIVYQALYGGFKMWVRPLTMFLEKVTIGGEIQPRFRFIE